MEAGWQIFFQVLHSILRRHFLDDSPEEFIKRNQELTDLLVHKTKQNKRKKTKQNKTQEKSSKLSFKEHTSNCRTILTWSLYQNWHWPVDSSTCFSDAHSWLYYKFNYCLNFTVYLSWEPLLPGKAKCLCHPSHCRVDSWVHSILMWLPLKPKPCSSSYNGWSFVISSHFSHKGQWETEFHFLFEEIVCGYFSNVQDLLARYSCTLGWMA